MSDQFIGEIRIFALDYAPYGFMTCQGQTLSTQQFTALYAILGITYGGNGTSYFNLPDLQGRCAMGTGQGPGTSPHSLGDLGGSSTVTLAAEQMPAHTHTLTAVNAQGTATVSKGNQPALVSGGGSKQGSNIGQVYSTNAAAVTTPMAQTSLAFTGLGKPHENMMPYLPLTFCIGVNGAWPPRPSL
jgi:microcystin-dependent protein